MQHRYRLRFILYLLLNQIYDAMPVPRAGTKRGKLGACLIIIIDGYLQPKSHYRSIEAK